MIVLGSITLAALLATGPIEVHTATRDVRGCRALDRGYVAATEGGVVFLDEQGVAEPALTTLDGLPETRSYVVESVMDSPSAIWVGTEGGLARIEHDEAGGRVVEVFESAPVRALVQDRGRTFVGTWGEGVLELRDGKLVALAGPELAKADRVTDLVIHRDQLVVASAGAGAWIVGEAPQRVEGVEGIVWSLVVHDQQLYAGTFVGVVELAGSDSITVSSHDARALASVDGELLIGSHGQGLARLDASTPPGPAITHVQGLDGDRCIATSEGLWIRSGSRWTPSLVDGLPSGDITAMIELDDRLYVGTFERGVMVYEAGRWSPLADPEGLIDPQINALVAAPEGRLWIATARGLYRAGQGEVETWTTKTGLPHANVLSLALARDGELIVGTHGGVAIVDGKGKVRELGTRARAWATWAIAEADDGSLWLGTTQGLIHWQSDGSWSHYSMLSGHLDDNWVTALLIEGAKLHVGTYAAGVMTLTKSKRANEWRSESLDGGRINPGGLSLVGGRLHAATMKGLLVREDQRWQTQTDALFEDVTGVLEVDRGVWIASRRGLVLY